ncbi:MAG TPA: hypothetical protein VN688_00535 [Gemmataceae bacterium]|nr:hypothetical protein [Gemmataceae bacterium]
MDQKTVEKLESKIEEAIAEIIVRMGLKNHAAPANPPNHALDGKSGGNGLRSGG